MKTCLEQHNICNADCCRYIKVEKKNIKKFGKLLQIKVPKITSDMAKYFILRGFMAKEGRETIYIHSQGQIIEKLTSSSVRIKSVCKALKGCLCSLHGTKEKPAICQYLTWDTKDDPKIYLTKGCIYLGEKDDGD